MGFVLRLLRLGIFVLMPGGQEVQVYIQLEMLEIFPE
jgi:hypothetical protein